MEDICLVLLAHGSQNPEWKKPFESLLRQMEEKVGKKRVFLAYLEYTPPNIEEIIRKIPKDKKILLWPFFLSLGGHVGKDIPKIVGQLEKEHSVSIQILPCLGELPSLVVLL